MHIISVARPAAFAALLAISATACGPEADQPPSGPASEPRDVPEQAGTAAGDVAPAPARTPAPDGARVFFVTPGDGDVVENPVRVEFGIEGMDVLPAGQAASNSGHHHVLIDTGLPALDLPIPADASHVHFGDGSSSTELNLEPGEHTLQLLFADHLHIPHDPPVYSEPITIVVQ